MNQAGIELLKRFEGFVGHAYKDPVGVLTIGYGFTKGVKPGDTMTREEAEVRLKKSEDRHLAIMGLITEFKTELKDHMEQEEKDVEKNLGPIRDSLKKLDGRWWSALTWAAISMASGGLSLIIYIWTNMGVNP